MCSLSSLSPSIIISLKIERTLLIKKNLRQVPFLKILSLEWGKRQAKQKTQSDAARSYASQAHHNSIDYSIKPVTSLSCQQVGRKNVPRVLLANSSILPCFGCFMSQQSSRHRQNQVKRFRPARPRQSIFPLSSFSCMEAGRHE